MQSRPVALVVSRNLRVRRILKESLLGSGFEVVSSEEGEEAIDISFLWPPKLAIIDRELGDMPGQLLVKRLRRFLGEPGLSAFYPAMAIDRVDAAPLVLLQAY